MKKGSDGKNLHICNFWLFTFFTANWFLHLLLLEAVRARLPGPSDSGLDCQTQPMGFMTCLSGGRLRLSTHKSFQWYNTAFVLTTFVVFFLSLLTPTLSFFSLTFHLLVTKSFSTGWGLVMQTWTYFFVYSCLFTGPGSVPSWQVNSQSENPEWRKSNS